MLYHPSSRYNSNLEVIHKCIPPLEKEAGRQSTFLKREDSTITHIYWTEIKTLFSFSGVDDAEDERSQDNHVFLLNNQLNSSY